MSSPHSGLIELNLHRPFHYEQDADPGAVGAGKYWLDTNSGPPLEVRRRNATDDGWVLVGNASGISSVTVREVDTTPSVAATVLEFPNDRVTDQGGGVARYTEPRLDQVTAPTADVSLNSQKITNLANPVASTDAVNLQTLTDFLSGLLWKAPVRAATTSAGTLASDFEDGDIVDGVTIATNDRILIKNQASPAENGIYIVAASGAPARSSDANSAVEVLQMAVFISEGTVNADKGFVCSTNAPITLDTTGLVFVQFPSSGGAALTVQEIDGSPLDSAVTVIRVTNGKLTDNGDGDITLDLGGGGSGATIHDEAYGTPPASEAAGDLWVPPDSYYILRRNDGDNAWIPNGPISPLNLPVDGDFSWVNQGGATIDSTKGGIHLAVPTDGGSNLRLRVKSAPTTPYTITACFLPRLFGANYHTIGFGFRQSSDGKIAAIILQHNNGYGIGVHKWTSATVYSAAYLANVGILSGRVLWVQVTDNGTNRICRWSTDGFNWLVIHTVGNTDFLTADQLVYFGDSFNATWPLGLTLISWKEE